MYTANLKCFGETAKWPLKPLEAKHLSTALKLVYIKL